jgi:TPR repeat protein
MPDLAEAVKWYRRSAVQGFPNAMHTLGGLYLQGRGLPMDAVEAYVWLTLAATHYASGDRLAEAAATLSSQARAMLSPEDISKADARIDLWKAVSEE